MNLKELAKTIAGLGLPAIGGALLGPGGVAAGKLLAGALGLGEDATPEQLATAVGNVTGDQMVALKNIDAKMAKDRFDYELGLRQADSADLASVNKTMQEEGKSEHWMQWSWRPLNGYALALGSFALVLGVLYMAVVAVLNKDFATLNAIPTVVMAVTAALAVPGAVCGVTAWHRGVAQRIEAQNGAGA